MNKFLEPIRVAYPEGNKPIFEEWIYDKFTGCNTDRVPLPFFATSYFVNNGYNENRQANMEAQEYIDSLDRSKKYWTVVQYDNGIFVDLKDLDVLQFNMSKKNGVEMPLLCQPHPYKFSGGKKHFASFVGSRTHPIRNELDRLIGKDGFYISFEPHSPEQYCRIMHESIFTLCPRGYGANSFRIFEAVQYESIPVYISDEFIDCFDAEFEMFGVKIKSEYASMVEEILQIFSSEDIIEKQSQGALAYNRFYTYEGAMQRIIETLEKEYAKA